MNSELPEHLKTALRNAVGLMQRGASDEALGDVIANYGELVRTHKAAVLAFLAAEMEAQTHGSFSVREADFALLGTRREFSRGPALCLAVCRSARRKAVVAILKQEEELYFIPTRPEPSMGLRVQKVD